MVPAGDLAVTGLDKTAQDQMGLTNGKRYYATLGTTPIAGDFALHANWGATASIGSIVGNDQRLKFTVTSAGAGTGLNPTIIFTFKDGTWTTAPFAYVIRNGGDQPTVVNTVATSATTLTITFNGTPVAGETYTYIILLMG